MADNCGCRFRFAPENKTEAQQYAFLPFGSGGRSCVAMRLAILELKVAVVKVISAFKIETTSETPKPVSLPHNHFFIFFWNSCFLKIGVRRIEIALKLTV